jgi:hypothetical protein
MLIGVIIIHPHSFKVKEGHLMAIEAYKDAGAEHPFNSCN